MKGRPRGSPDVPLVKGGCREAAGGFPLPEIIHGALLFSLYGRHTGAPGNGPMGVSGPTAKPEAPPEFVGAAHLGRLPLPRNRYRHAVGAAHPGRPESLRPGFNLPSEWRILMTADRERRCTCGGVMKFSGRQALHMNGSPFFLESSTEFTQVDVYVCPDCRKVEFTSPNFRRRSRWRKTPCACTPRVGEGAAGHSRGPGLSAGCTPWGPEAFRAADRAQGVNL